ncbi:MAG: hypothetical protein ACK2UK_19000 [Candidatus Promineifilaceae bacterium]|jgi:hypothetical protein
MDSNYQWQKHRSSERIHSHMKEAQAHRLAKKGTPQRDSIGGRAWNWFSGLFQRSTRRREALHRNEPAIRSRPSS